MATTHTAYAVTLNADCGMCQTMWGYVCPVCHGHFCGAHAEDHKASVKGFRQAIQAQLAVDKERALRSPRGWAT
jgi:hypothetical protein